MLNYVLIFISLLTSTRTQNVTQNRTLDDTDNPTVSDHENCYYICPTWPNVIAFVAIITLLCCICAAVCQQQPREIFYLVDRSPDDRPPNIPFDPQPAPKTKTELRSNNSINASKQPIVTEPPSPKRESPVGEDENSPRATTSTEVDVSPQEPVVAGTLPHTQLYSAQESIEDEPIPIPTSYTAPSPDETPVKPSPEVTYREIDEHVAKS